MQGGNPQQQAVPRVQAQHHGAQQPVQTAANNGLGQIEITLPVATPLNVPTVELLVVNGGEERLAAPSLRSRLLGLSEGLNRIVSMLGSGTLSAYMPLPQAAGFDPQTVPNAGDPTPVVMGFPTACLEVIAEPYDTPRIGGGDLGFRARLRHWFGAVSQQISPAREASTSLEPLIHTQQEIQETVVKLGKGKKQVDQDFKTIKPYLEGLEALHRLLHSPETHAVSESGGGDPKSAPIAEAKTPYIEDQQWVKILEPMNYFVSEFSLGTEQTIRLTESLEEIITTQRNLVVFFNRLGQVITSFIMQYLWFYYRSLPQCAMSDVKDTAANPVSVKKSIKKSMAELELSMLLHQDPDLMQALESAGVVSPVLKREASFQKAGEMLHAYVIEDTFGKTLSEVALTQTHFFSNLRNYVLSFQDELSRDMFDSILDSVETLKKHSQELVQSMELIAKAGESLDQYPKKAFLEQFYQDLLAYTKARENPV